MGENNKKPNGYWNYNRCLEQAKKYEYKKEFYKNSKSAYAIALKKGWLKDYYWFKDGYKISGDRKRKWTYDTCKEEAKKYQSKNDFKKGCISAYQVAFRNGWIDDYDWFENGKTIGIEKRTKWTYDACLEEAKKYKYQKEFENKSSGAYQSARKNKWLKDYDFFEDGNKLRWDRDKKWNYERCLEEAKKYSTRGDFAKECNSAYKVARKHGWLKDYDFFERLPNAIIDGDSVYAYFFHQQHAVYVGRTINTTQRHQEHTNPNKKSSVFKFAKEHNIEIPQMTILETKLSLKDGLIRENYYLNKYREEGWTIINKAKTGVGCGSIGGIKLNRKWNDFVRHNDVA